MSTKFGADATSDLPVFKGRSCAVSADSISEDIILAEGEVEAVYKAVHEKKVKELANSSYQDYVRLNADLKSELNSELRIHIN
jgi:hypothetical protein